MWIGVRPLFTTLAIWEVAIGTTDSDVKDEIVRLVEWSALLAFILPWVGHAIWEFTLGPHIFVKWEVHNLDSVNG